MEGRRKQSFPLTPHTQGKRKGCLPVERQFGSWSKAQPDSSKLTLQTFGSTALHLV